MRVSCFVCLQCLIFLCHICWCIFGQDEIPNCSKNPVITLIKRNNYTILPSHHNKTEILMEGNHDIEFSCHSKLPVKFKFEGFKSDMKIKSALTFRHTRASDWDNPENFCHEAVIKVEPTIGATGNYVCSVLTKEKETNIASSDVYLYFKTSDVQNIVGAGTLVHVKVLPKDKAVVIHCRVKDPSIRTFLIKDGIKLNSTIIQRYYDPKMGYIFPISQNNVSEVLGNYICRCHLNPMNANKWYHIETNVSLMEDTIVTNDRNNASVPQEAIHLASKSTEHGQEDFNFICSLHNVRCFKYFHCGTPAECDLLNENFSSETKSVCSNEEEFCPSLILQSYDISSRKNCLHLPVKSGDADAGILRCDSHQNVQKRVRFFTDLNGKKVFDHADIPLTDVLQIVNEPWEIEEDELWTQMWYSITCQASKFRFSKGFRWAFLLSDGTIVKNVTTRKESSEEMKDIDHLNYYSETVEVKITDKNIEKIFCVAPVLDSQQWENVSIAVQLIRESILPEFKNPENEIVYFYPQRTTKNLSCEARGLPLPVIKWFHHTGIEVDINRQVISRKDPASNLINNFLSTKRAEVEDSNKTTFICNATNFRGSIFKNFTVILLPESKSYLSWVAFILALVLLVAILLLYNCILIYCTLQPYHNNTEVSELNSLVEQFFQGVNTDAETQTEIPPYATIPYSKDFEIPETSLLLLEEKLGEGQFGIVHKGILRDSSGDEKEIACKTLKKMNPPNREAFELLLEEIKILQPVGQHPNVIHCLGAITRDLKNYKAKIVMEFCSLGNLKNYLINHKTKFHDEFVEQEISSHFSQNSYKDSATMGTPYVQMEYEMKTSDLAQWALEIATGMQYLADKKLIHRDLAARNVVLNSKKVAKITDFGLCKNLASNIGQNEEKIYYRMFGNGPLPLRWLAPEVFISRICSVKSDVWAYGITLWEIFSLGEDPYPGQNDLEVPKFVIEDGKRMFRPLFANPLIYEIMLDCWKIRGDDRPRFEELRQRFKDIQQKFFKKDDITYSTLEFGNDGFEFEETKL